MSTYPTDDAHKLASSKESRTELLCRRLNMATENLSQKKRRHPLLDVMAVLGSIQAAWLPQNATGVFPTRSGRALK